MIHNQTNCRNKKHTQPCQDGNSLLRKQKAKVRKLGNEFSLGIRERRQKETRTRLKSCPLTVILQMNSLIHLLSLSEASEEFTGQEIFHHCLIFSDTWWPKLLRQLLELYKLIINTFYAVQLAPVVTWPPLRNKPFFSCISS